MTPIKNSSNVAGAAYDPVNRVLSVRFTGGTVYEYPNVTAKQHQALLAAKSKGGWVTRNLVSKAHRHPAKKVNP